MSILKMDRKTFESLCNVLPPEIVEKIEGNLDALHRGEVVRKMAAAVNEYWEEKRRKEQARYGGVGGTSGGIFRLLANYGAQDRMLMSTDLLNERIREINRQREIKHTETRWEMPLFYS